VSKWIFRKPIHLHLYVPAIYTYTNFASSIANPNGNGYRNAHSNAKSNTKSETQSNTEASPHPAAAPVAVALSGYASPTAAHMMP
jgi:hypothetical protein